MPADDGRAEARGWRRGRGLSRWLLAELARLGEQLLPATCLLCAAPCGKENLCPPCVRELPYVGSACPRCAVPVDHGTTCSRCRDRPPPFSAATCALRYEGPVVDLIHRLKFSSDMAAGLALGEVLARRLCAGAPTGAEQVQCIVPIPLHPARLRARGFDQARLIGECVSRRLGVPLLRAAARRTRRTAAQATLRPGARARNVDGAFSVAAPAVAGRRVALVDDVLTSGATAGALATAALAAGAARVVVWACARSASPHASRLATDNAFVSMNSRRGST